MSIYEYNEEKHMQFVKEEGRKEGYESGCMEGREQGLTLTKLLLDMGRLDDLRRATEDKAFREQLFKKYGI